MKQAITIMAAVIAALLLAGGLVLNGNMEQSKVISKQGALMSELRDKLQKAQKQLDEQALNDETLGVALANRTEERDAAMSALEESEAAVRAQAQALLDAKDAHAKELQKLADAARQKQAAIDELDAALAMATDELAATVTRADGLAGELAQAKEAAGKAALESEQSLAAMKREHDQSAKALAARNEEVLAAAKIEHDESLKALAAQHQNELAAAKAEHDKSVKTLNLQHEEALAAARAEAAAFAALAEIWADAQLGESLQSELDEAAAAFALAYPDSEYLLPQARPTAQPSNQAPLSDATQAPVGSPSPGSPSPGSPSPGSPSPGSPSPGSPSPATPAPSQTLPPVANELT